MVKRLLVLCGILVSSFALAQGPFQISQAGLLAERLGKMGFETKFQNTRFLDVDYLEGFSSHVLQNWEDFRSHFESLRRAGVQRIRFSNYNSLSFHFQTKELQFDVGQYQPIRFEEAGSFLNIALSYFELNLSKEFPSLSEIQLEGPISQQWSDYLADNMKTFLRNLCDRFPLLDHIEIDTESNSLLDRESNVRVYEIFIRTTLRTADDPDLIQSIVEGKGFPYKRLEYYKKPDRWSNGFEFKRREGAFKGRDVEVHLTWVDRENGIYRIEVPSEKDSRDKQPVHKKIGQAFTITSRGRDGESYSYLRGEDGGYGGDVTVYYQEGLRDAIRIDNRGGRGGRGGRRLDGFVFPTSDSLPDGQDGRDGRIQWVLTQ